MQLPNQWPWQPSSGRPEKDPWEEREENEGQERKEGEGEEGEEGKEGKWQEERKERGQEEVEEAWQQQHYWKWLEMLRNEGKCCRCLTMLFLAFQNNSVLESKTFNIVDIFSNLNFFLTCSMHADAGGAFRNKDG